MNDITTTISSVPKLLERKLKQLCLTSFATNYQNLAERYEKENKSYTAFLSELVDNELEHRCRKRVERLLKQAKLPRMKTLETFRHKRIPGLSRSQIDRLSSGKFIERYENVLIFGNPGTGKTHLAIALAQEWCMQGRRIYYTSVAQLIQNLLKAKSELMLNNLIKKLDRFEVLIIDDISYIPCDRDETDVLFTLLSERYETRSVLITSNLPFAKWDTIFKDKMTTAAVVDRLIHHSTILELNAESYRLISAKSERKKKEIKN